VNAKETYYRSKRDLLSNEAEIAGACTLGHAPPQLSPACAHDDTEPEAKGQGEAQEDDDHVLSAPENTSATLDEARREASAGLATPSAFCHTFSGNECDCLAHSPPYNTFDTPSPAPASAAAFWPCATPRGQGVTDLSPIKLTPDHSTLRMRSGGTRLSDSAPRAARRPVAFSPEKPVAFPRFSSGGAGGEEWEGDEERGREMMMMSMESSMSHSTSIFAPYFSSDPCLKLDDFARLPSADEMMEELQADVRMEHSRTTSCLSLVEDEEPPHALASGSGVEMLDEQHCVTLCGLASGVKKLDMAQDALGSGVEKLLEKQDMAPDALAFSTQERETCEPRRASCQDQRCQLAPELSHHQFVAGRGIVPTHGANLQTAARDAVSEESVSWPPPPAHLACSHAKGRDSGGRELGVKRAEGMRKPPPVVAPPLARTPVAPPVAGSAASSPPTTPNMELSTVDEASQPISGLSLSFASIVGLFCHLWPHFWALSPPLSLSP